jgi:integrase
MRARGTGCVRKVQGSKFWHIYYYCYGRQFRESSNSQSKAVAERLLQERLTEMGLGRQPEQIPTKVKYEDIRQLLLEDYGNKGHRSLVVQEDGEATVSGLKHLDQFFAGRRVASITSDVLRDFVRRRMKRVPGESWVTKSTVNRNLALLHRMMTLAWREGKVRSVPHFPMFPEKTASKGFIEAEQFDRLCNELPRRSRLLVTFLYRTGCSFGEAQDICLSDVDLETQTVRVGREKRLVPLDGQDELVAELKPRFDSYETDRTADDNGPDEVNDRIFSVKNFRKGWQRACIRLGYGRMESLPGGREVYRGLLVRDLRRAALRNMIESGVSENVAMTISGHKSRNVFKRFKIVATNDLHEAMKRVASGATSDGEETDK